MVAVVQQLQWPFSLLPNKEYIQHLESFPFWSLTNAFNHSETNVYKNRTKFIIYNNLLFLYIFTITLQKIDFICNSATQFRFFFFSTPLFIILIRIFIIPAVRVYVIYVYTLLLDGYSYTNILVLV